MKYFFGFCHNANVQVAILASYKFFTLKHPLNKSTKFVAEKRVFYYEYFLKIK